MPLIFPFKNIQITIGIFLKKMTQRNNSFLGLNKIEGNFLFDVWPKRRTNF